MTNSTKSPKKANLLDPHAIKHLLDESVTEIVTGKGFPEDFRTSNARLGIGSLIIAVALLAQLYPKKFPENRDLLLICIGLYPSFDFFFFFWLRIGCSEWHIAVHQLHEGERRHSFHLSSRGIIHQHGTSCII
ncbi:putative signal peptidase complex subunit 2 [Iris pallida]|uniref:Signal peptidase complex subunit 2 n=1 Tax=Iris pallida TaxID=29817 RepID=A0AAX6GDW9_IRIPA|nr:putative signal peptidase complex subunit 2 [Iris pallida]